MLIKTSKIKNIVFDIGNVLVRWSPETIVALTFGQSQDHSQLTQTIFKHEYWLQLNRGELTEIEAKKLYTTHLQFETDKIDLLFHHIKSTQELLHESKNLMQRLHQEKYQIFALTDNIREIITYLKQQYDFWQYFSGVVVSAEVGCLKPSAEIFQHLLKNHSLNPAETVFIDDLLINIEGARSQGMHGIQFLNSQQCEADLVKLGVI